MNRFIIFSLCVTAMLLYHQTDQKVFSILDDSFNLDQQELSQRIIQDSKSGNNLNILFNDVVGITKLLTVDIELLSKLLIDNTDVFYHTEYLFLKLFN